MEWICSFPEELPWLGQRACRVCAGAGIWGGEEQNSLICCACRQLGKLTFKKRQTKRPPPGEPSPARGCSAQAGPGIRGAGPVPLPPAWHRGCSTGTRRSCSRVPEASWAWHRGRNRCGNAKMCDALSGRSQNLLTWLRCCRA